jgi:phosphoribosylformimino-5-aminoimidazole carboxamide ribotide isomerase
VEIWPAIDLLGGKCVRLRRGEYTAVTVFDENPVEVARRWCQQGADRLHLVDLDAAKTGNLTNLEAIRAIREAVPAVCQVGGGIRSDEAAERVLGLGIDRVIVGTAALANPEWFRSLSHRYPRRIVLSLDAREGRVAIRGWQETTSVLARDAARTFADLPLAAIVFTDIATDGMLTGPNLAAVLALQAEVDIPVIASGGIAGLEDIKALAEGGVKGCIIGRALYEGTVHLPDVFRFLEKFKEGQMQPELG